VLALGTDVRNQSLRAERLAVTLLAYVIAAPATPGRCRPDIAGDQLQKLRLSRTVRTEQGPSLAGANSPVDVEKNAAAATIESDVFKINRQRTGSQSRTIRNAACVSPSRRRVLHARHLDACRGIRARG